VIAPTGATVLDVTAVVPALEPGGVVVAVADDGGVDVDVDGGLLVDGGFVEGFVDVDDDADGVGVGVGFVGGVVGPQGPWLRLNWPDHSS
jgi:hypothetical protein